MKSLLLAALLLLTFRVVAQPAYSGPEVAAPIKWSSVVVVHTTDSARVAYTKAVRGLLAGGFGLDKTDKDALFASTAAKPLDSVTFMLIQASVVPTPTGSDITLRGLYSWASGVMIMAHRENRLMPIQYIGHGSTPTQRSWEVMQRLAAGTFPDARLGYK